MVGKQFNNLPWLIQDSEMLDEEQQKKLLNFLLNILMDTKSIYVKCDRSHNDLYLEITDCMNDLNIIRAREDWNITNPNTWKVQIDFLYPLRSLLNIRWEYDEEI